MEIKVIVARNIRRLREESRKSKSELCRVIGMSRAFWDDVEAGNKEAKISTYERIASALGVSVRDLFAEETAYAQEAEKKPKRKRRRAA